MISPSVALLFLLFAHLNPDAGAAFDRYVAQAESGRSAQAVRDPNLRGGQTRTEQVAATEKVKLPGAMLQDWVGTVFMPGATIEQVRCALQDYPDYKKFYGPKVIESRELEHTGDDYDITLRLKETHYFVTVFLSTTYHVRYETPDAQHLLVTSRATHIGQLKNAGKPNEVEMTPDQDWGVLWRLNSYWRFEAADGGIYGRCEAISLSRDVPGFLRGFVSSFPKKSMDETLEGTLAAVNSHPANCN